jgi:uncharacterized protein (TIGR02284 family)
MDNGQAISTLHQLIETCRSGEREFRAAAAAVSNPTAKSVFSECADQRAEMMRELQQEVRTLGGDPDPSAGIAASGRRDRPHETAAGHDDDAGIIARAGQEEEAARKAYEEAFTDGGLPPTSAAVVRLQGERVKAAHDRVRALEKAQAR